LAGVVWFMGFTIISASISAQEAKNAFLEKEIAALKKDIEEISRLKDQTDALLKRKQVIESLQGNRAETLRMFDELLRRVPDGIRIVNLNQNGTNIDLNGESVSEARVSTLIRNLEDSSTFQNVSPIEIRAGGAPNGRQLFLFQLKMQIERQAAAAPAGKGMAAPPDGKGITGPPDGKGMAPDGKGMTGPPDGRGMPGGPLQGSSKDGKP
jgi:type IV pilus assembly protein PilN